MILLFYIVCVQFVGTVTQPTLHRFLWKQWCFYLNQSQMNYQGMKLVFRIFWLLNVMAKSEMNGFNRSNMSRYRLQYVPRNIDGLAQDFSNSIAIAVELLQSCISYRYALGFLPVVVGSQQIYQCPSGLLFWHCGTSVYDYIHYSSVIGLVTVIGRHL